MPLKITDFFMFKSKEYDVPMRYYFVEWRMRPDGGLNPMDSFVTEAEIEEADKEMLLRFLHEQFCKQFHER